MGDLCVPLLRLSVLQLDLILHVLHDGTAVSTYTLETVPAEELADWQKQVRIAILWTKIDRKECVLSD